jgi:hypothetical protein
MYGARQRLQCPRCEEMHGFDVAGTAGRGDPMSTRRSKSRDKASDHARGLRTLPQLGGLSLGYQRCHDVALRTALSRAFCGLVFHTAHKLLVLRPIPIDARNLALYQILYANILSWKQ